MHKLVGAILLAAALAGCATESDPGWTSDAHAMAWDRAVQECTQRTQSTSGPGYEECMASLGWTRPQH
ncbi:MAG TPA: hypothetical protein VHC73_02675 [Vitreimonas sp.]|jgi:hypothetical protein|nr:hypothetical protein [Vitreimonas sp.]